MAFNALVLSLPTRNSTIRMRVWRALKETGCGVLRDGVYVLPEGSAGSAVLSEMESEIRSAGGFAMTVELKLRTTGQTSDVRKLFDRSVNFGALVQKIGVAKAALPRSFREAYFSGEPQPSRKRLRRVDRVRYQKRVWATRKAPWVDRLASAWLIRRLIDREARFAWIGRSRERPRKAVGFDFDGAEFTHLDNRVTFEVLLACFGLDGDPALALIGAVFPERKHDRQALRTA